MDITVGGSWVADIFANLENGELDGHFAMSRFGRNCSLYILIQLTRCRYYSVKFGSYKRLEQISWC